MKAIACTLLLAGLWPTCGWAQGLINRSGEVYLQGSFDLAKESIKEKTQYAQFLSDTEDVFSLNLGLYRQDLDVVRDILKRYGGKTAGVNQRIMPIDATLLVAANDTLPGPELATTRPSSWGQIGLLYGVQFIGKGAGDGGSTTRINYLEPMAYVLYSYELPRNQGRLFAGLGPYVALGLWGNAKSGSYSASVFNSQSGYSRFDAGLALTVGYALPQGLRLSLAREIGLVNIDSSDPDEKVYNRVWSLNVAYPLKKLVTLVKKK